MRGGLANCSRPPKTARPIYVGEAVLARKQSTPRADAFSRIRTCFRAPPLKSVNCEQNVSEIAFEKAASWGHCALVSPGKKKLKSIAGSTDVSTFPSQRQRRPDSCLESPLRRQCTEALANCARPPKTARPIYEGPGPPAGLVSASKRWFEGRLQGKTAQSPIDKACALEKRLQSAGLKGV